MKILQVMAGAGRGGAETAFTDITIALHEAGETVVAVTRPNDIRMPLLRAAAVPVYTLPFGGFADIYTPWALAKIIRKFQPDVVQTWMARAAAKTPHWNASMNIPPYTLAARLGGYYKLKYFKTADHFVVNTPDIGHYLVEAGVPTDKVTHINNFAQDEVAHNPLNRSDFGTPENATLVAALGRLHPNKAFDVLIRAVAELPEVYLWLAGEGPERATLEKLAQDLGAQGRIKFLGWRSDRADLFAAADLCVISSRHEPFGNVFIQAWAQRVPLITTASEGPRQYVRDGEDALVVPVNNVGALKEAITRLASDEALQERLCGQGYRRYSAEFTKENTVRSYLELYHSLSAVARKGI